MIIPVAHALQRKGFETTVLGLTNAGEQLDRAELTHVGFRHFVTPADASALEVGRRLAQELPPSPIPLQESIAYLGLSYAELQDRVGRVAAERAYKERGRGAFLPLATLDRIITRIQPDLVVATSSPRAEEAAIMVADRRGIPSVCLVNLFLPNRERAPYRSGFSQRVCVLHSQVKASLVEAGRSPHEVVVTGNPAFDALASPRLRARAQRMRERRGWTGKRVILYAADEEPEDPSLRQTLPVATEDSLVEGLRRNPNWVGIVRRHPGLRHIPLRRSHPRLHLSGSDDHLPTLLNAVDVVLTHGSTLGLEAAIAGKRVLTLGSSAWAYACPSLKLGVAEVVESLDDLLPLLGRDRAATGPSLPEVGTATARVANVLDEVLAS